MNPASERCTSSIDRLQCPAGFVWSPHSILHTYFPVWCRCTALTRPSYCIFLKNGLRSLIPVPKVRYSRGVTENESDGFVTSPKRWFCWKNTIQVSDNQIINDKFKRFLLPLNLFLILNLAHESLSRLSLSESNRLFCRPRSRGRHVVVLAGYKLGYRAFFLHIPPGHGLLLQRHCSPDIHTRPHSGRTAPGCGFLFLTNQGSVCAWYKRYTRIQKRLMYMLPPLLA